MSCSALAVQCGESPLTNLASVLYRAFQKHSNKATPGQQYRSFRRESKLELGTLCTYILNIFSGNGFVVTINRPFGYNYDIQPFHPCSVLQGGRGGETT